jgi:hypothetical protein
MNTLEHVLDPEHMYEWFITHVETRNVKGSDVLIIHWNNTDVDIIVKEYLRIIPQDFRSTRLYHMMVQLGYEDKDKTIMPEVEGVIRKGLHMRAKPMRVWGSISSESMEWKINYDTIAPTSTDQSCDLPDDDVRKLLALAARQPNHKETLIKVASVRPDWVRGYLTLYDQGKITFAKQS